MNVDKRKTDLFRAAIKTLPERDYISGDLLVLTDVGFTNAGIINKLKPILNGYPSKFSFDYVSLNIVAKIQVGAPFMFLGWAAYSYAYFPTIESAGHVGLDQKLALVTDIGTGRPEPFFGMNILFGNKIFLLTPGHTSSHTAAADSMPLTERFYAPQSPQGPKPSSP